MQIEVSRTHAGPPTMGHGGYVAGLLAARAEPGPVQVTIRKPVPLDVPLDLVDLDGDRHELRRGDELLVESERVEALVLDVPTPPSTADARASEPDSPSHYNGTGVHPTCFGCGAANAEGLRIFAGPVEADGQAQVAGVWRPEARHLEADGTVGRTWVLAALDCPGAFAFIAGGVRAGLLGRIVFALHDDGIRGDADLLVTGWTIATEGRKMFAGTAMFAVDGRLLASAKATWFGFAPPSA
jgi:hypothetical protein